MASGGLVQELCEELTCPICLDYFRNPATIAECGHNFCRACLNRSWGEAAAKASCPQCREIVQQRNLKPNWQLANVVEIAKKLSLQEGEAKGRVCEKHQEPLKLFCREDRGLICVVCVRSEERRHLRVIPMGKAARKYKDILRGYNEIQMNEREKILVRKVDTEKQSQDKLERTESAREKSVANFRKWHQFLEEKEHLLVAQMEEVEKEITRERDKQLARLSWELSSLESLIQEMQKKIQQPDSELLQDVESVLKRCEKQEEIGNSTILNPELMWKTKHIWDINHFLEADLKQFKVANVTDPDTAHPDLSLSEDQCRRCRDKAHNLSAAFLSHKGSSHHSSQASPNLTKHTKSHHSASCTSCSSRTSFTFEVAMAKAKAAAAAKRIEFVEKEGKLRIEAARLEAEKDVLQKEAEVATLAVELKVLQDEYGS